ncbi:MAG: LLM class F420-dependent oxidoreductase [Actinomycetota bacterium]|nr:LLM class F420-dependent oxidoreductase [Actinomycetota bacterium]
MKFGVTLGTVSSRYWLDVALAADRLGYESIWLPEHLVLPIHAGGSPFEGQDHPPIPADTPVHEPIGYLCYLAALTSQVRLGTYVYLLGLRHPFASARGWATLDIVSNGRALTGVGAGWLTAEWRAAGLDPRTRGERLDEAIEICRRLWTEPVIEHHGPFFEFEPVAFEPKPVQQPIPVHVGGESPVALRRAARSGDGWIGMAHTPESAAPRVASLRQAAREHGRAAGTVQVTVSGECDDHTALIGWSEAGVDRLIVRPWKRSSDAVEAMGRFAEAFPGHFHPVDHAAPTGVLYDRRHGGDQAGQSRDQSS